MKSNLLLKALVAIIFILAAVGIFMVAGAGENTSPEMSNAASFMVNIAYILLIAAVAITVILSLFGLFKNPTALKKTLLGLLALGIVLVVSYVMADDAAVLDAQGNVLKDGEAGAVSKWVGTGLTYSLVLGAIGFVFFVIDLLKGLVKS